MSARSFVPRFPAVAFASQADFIEYRREMQGRLDARHLFETAQATWSEALTLPGTCAPCLRPATFTTATANWQRQPDGRRVPDWTEGLICDCTDQLGGRARALIHAALALGGLRPDTRLLLFGPAHPSHRRLAALARETRHVPALRSDGAGGFRLEAEVERFHLAVAADCLQRVPPLEAGLAALRRALAPGGALLFTVPFHPHDASSRAREDLRRPDGTLPAEVAEAAHEIGWDILERLRTAGFAQAMAYNYWSAELGYLGPFNMLFHAAL